jgi:hypothetical protein
MGYNGFNSPNRAYTIKPIPLSGPAFNDNQYVRPLVQQNENVNALIPSNNFNIELNGQP